MKNNVRKMQKREEIVEKRIDKIKQTMKDRQQELFQTHEEERSILVNQADSYKLLTAELKTENRDLKSSLADMQRSLIKTQ